MNYLKLRAVLFCVAAKCGWCSRANAFHAEVDAMLNEKTRIITTRSRHNAR